ncbi:MAG: SDR family oxidoreductase [Chitinivibrionales bacterium]|nr:SDR family oxidoreductase [Chitinivibrionales bacterium]
MIDLPVVLVTGASRGLGAAIAVEFGRRGYFVCVHYRYKEQQATAVLETIRSNGGDGMIIQFDLRRTDGIHDAVETIVSFCGRIDTLINNAAVISDAYFPLMTGQQWTEVIETNVHGTFACTHAVITRMMARGSGAIVNIASITAIRGSPGQANYAASKGAIVSLTRSLAVEMAPRNIRVNALLPGLIDTGMTRRLNRIITQQKQAMIPMGRLGQPEEVASAAYFLGSDQSLYITGQILAVDGGLCA